MVVTGVLEVVGPTVEAGGASVDTTVDSRGAAELGAAVVGAAAVGVAVVGVAMAGAAVVADAVITGTVIGGTSSAGGTSCANVITDGPSPIGSVAKQATMRAAAYRARWGRRTRRVTFSSVENWRHPGVNLCVDTTELG